MIMAVESLEFENIKLLTSIGLQPAMTFYDIQPAVLVKTIIVPIVIIINIVFIIFNVVSISGIYECSLCCTFRVVLWSL